jgi:class 3 adenylate cyclase
LVSSATDVRSMLGAIQAPTLVIHAASDRFVRVAHGRYLAEHIHGAHYVELATGDHVPWAAEVDFTGEIEEFLTGTRHVVVSDRLLSTVLFTDIVGSTQHAAAIGDQRWRERLQQHDLAVERQIKRFGGRLVKNIGDGVLATFDGPARAISCALTIRDAVRQLGLEVRVGLHTGEIERRGDDVAGIAVHLAQRVMDTAMPGEVLVSRTVVDLVAGSGIEFVDRGEHQLRGIPGSWRLHAVC